MRRLVLFDIDGTLVAGGPAKEAFHHALIDTFGRAGSIEVHDFAGKTDPQIARELLLGAGVANGEIDRGLAELWPRYLGRLSALLLGCPMDVLPGVEDLMEELAARDDFGLGLLTGNIAGGAELKLRSAGLFGYFRFGSYGSDSEERDDLAVIALRRAEETWGAPVDPRDVFVIGDTPRDVQCGQRGGTRTLAVATGRYGAADLAAAGADHVMESLENTRQVLSALSA